MIVVRRHKRTSMVAIDVLNADEIDNKELLTETLRTVGIEHLLAEKVRRNGELHFKDLPVVRVELRHKYDEDTDTVEVL